MGRNFFLRAGDLVWKTCVHNSRKKNLPKVTLRREIVHIV